MIIEEEWEEEEEGEEVIFCLLSGLQFFRKIVLISEVSLFKHHL